ncbi:MAG: amino acid adenylation domain-containing protein, partial [bacterium]|nr:amino acid adenylation domain-containing protein [bacterium]
RSLEIIVAMLAVLKAGGAYLPIDLQYPPERSRYMLEDSGTQLLLTTRNSPGTTSESPTWNSRQTLYMDEIELKQPGVAHSQTAKPSDLAYIIYTSGTSGRPKGVLIEHRNAVRLFFNDRFPFQFDRHDTWTMFHSHCFDFSVWEIYGALLFGGKLIIIPKMTARDPKEFFKLVQKEKVTVLNQTPSAFYNLSREAGHLNDQTALRYVIFGGEALNPGKLTEWQKKYPHVKLINMYGITETTVHVTFKEITSDDIQKEISNIGTPIPTLSTYVFAPPSRGETNHYLQPIGVPGELCVAGAGVARGYLNRPRLTAEKFVENPFKPGELMYRSGDMARVLPNGEMEYLGRTDHQVQIRGFRVEPGEIENRLLKHEDVKQAVVVSAEHAPGDTYLCAYLVVASDFEPTAASALKNFLAKDVPDYMIPAYFMTLEKIPLTSNGKLDRKALPAANVKSQITYTPPRDHIEERIVHIWEGLLNTPVTSTNAIGIDDNFFQLGGHSLKATVLVSRLHKELEVVVPLAEVFKTPTIRGLAQFIKYSLKNTFVSIEPVEKKEYYPLSSAQKRLFILQQMEMNSTVYNMPQVIPLPQAPDVDKLEKTFTQLINRHESLRTSFHIINEEPVQKVHDNVDFAITHCDLTTGNTNTQGTLPNIPDGNRPFDLSRAPLLRVALVKMKNSHLLFVDMHHIISDGVSHQVLEQDFTTLYREESLPHLRIQYKDFSHWRNSGKEQNNLKKQEVYWLKEFNGDVPVLNLPTDYPRPSIQSFEGGILNFRLGKNETTLLKSLALEEGVTLYMVLLGLFNVFLSKVGNMEDIVIGTPTAGRRHPDLEQVMGMFVNTLALRNYPNSNKSFLKFLHEVKERTLEAFENQDYPFEDLVENIEVNRDAGRNPLFDVLFNFQGHSPAGEEPPGEYADETQTKKQEFIVTSKFDLTLHALDTGERILFTFEYCSKLFKEETIRRFISYFTKTAGELLSHTDKKLLEVDILSEAEKNRILYDFNDTAANYPQNKTIHQLFEEQVRKAPDHTALTAPYGPTGTMPTGTGNVLTYKALDERAFLLACVLREKGVKAGHIVGLALPRSLEIIVAMLAVLKAGGAYLPIDLQYPPERSRYMLEDSGTQLLLTTR